MIVDSRTSPTGRGASGSLAYRTSAPLDEDYAWIQPPITQQAFDFSRTSLIDGLYVQTLRVDVIVIPIRKTPSGADFQLDAMAADPDIQREIRQIQSEFDGTEMDGLSDAQG